MKNQDFELQCKQILEVKHNEVTKFIGTVLNKEGKELDKSISQHAVLAYILPELLTYGCVVRTSTKEIAEACNCKTTVVNNVLGFAGFKYERDRVTHKKDYVSKGLFERYYQYEYTDNGATKKTSSIFNIVATQKLFDLLAEELGLEIKIDAEALAKLHADSKAKAYTKSVKRETVVIKLTRETTVFSNAQGTTNTVQYSGINAAMKQLQEIQEEQQEAVIESEEDVEALLAQAEEEDDFDFDFLTTEDGEPLFTEDGLALVPDVDEEESTEPQPEVEEAPVEETKGGFAKYLEEKRYENESCNFEEAVREAIEAEKEVIETEDEEPETDYSAGLEIEEESVTEENWDEIYEGIVDGVQRTIYFREDEYITTGYYEDGKFIEVDPFSIEDVEEKK